MFRRYLMVLCVMVGLLIANAVWQETRHGEVLASGKEPTQCGYGSVALRAVCEEASADSYGRSKAASSRRAGIAANWAGLGILVVAGSLIARFVSRGRWTT